MLLCCSRGPTREGVGLKGRSQRGSRRQGSSQFRPRVKSVESRCRNVRTAAVSAHTNIVGPPVLCCLPRHSVDRRPFIIWQCLVEFLKICEKLSFLLVKLKQSAPTKLHIGYSVNIFQTFLQISKEALRLTRHNRIGSSPAQPASQGISTISS